MKRIILATALMLSMISAWGQEPVGPAHHGDPSHGGPGNGAPRETFAPFYNSDKAPHLERILPPPPEPNSSRFVDDSTMYLWGKSIRETERGQLAIADAGQNAAYFLKRFSPAVGRELTPETYPELYKLFSRAHSTERVAGASAKRYFARIRPYQRYQEPTSVPGSERMEDHTSYPSGHTHAAWLMGLILTSLDPDHTEAIMNTAYEMGESRVIVGFHYQSDIEAGRVAGSVTFARLMSEPEFIEMLDAARKEYNANAKTE